MTLTPFLSQGQRDTPYGSAQAFPHLLNPEPGVPNLPGCGGANRTERRRYKSHCQACQLAFNLRPQTGFCTCSVPGSTAKTMQRKKEICLGYLSAYLYVAVIV